MTKGHAPTDATNRRQDAKLTKGSPTDLVAHLDTLLAQYLNLLDTYTTLRAELSGHLSSGFFNLATANRNGTLGAGRRYGEDGYDSRMKALRRVEVQERAQEHVREGDKALLDEALTVGRHDQGQAAKGKSKTDQDEEPSHHHGWEQPEPGAKEKAILKEALNVGNYDHEDDAERKDQTKGDKEQPSDQSKESEEGVDALKSAEDLYSSNDAADNDIIRGAEDPEGQADQFVPKSGYVFEVFDSSVASPAKASDPMEKSTDTSPTPPANPPTPSHKSIDTSFSIHANHSTPAPSQEGTTATSSNEDTNTNPSKKGHNNTIPSPTSIATNVPTQSPSKDSANTTTTHASSTALAPTQPSSLAPPIGEFIPQSTTHPNTIPPSTRSKTSSARSSSLSSDDDFPTPPEFDSPPTPPSSSDTRKRSHDSPAPRTSSHTSQPASSAASNSKSAKADTRPAPPSTSQSQSDPKPKVGDPLRWYGILTPAALKACQKSFIEAIENTVPDLVNAANLLRACEDEIWAVRGKMGILKDYDVPNDSDMSTEFRGEEGKSQGARDEVDELIQQAEVKRDELIKQTQGRNKA